MTSILRKPPRKLGLVAHLLCGVAISTAMAAPARADEPLRILSLNIWNKFKANPQYAEDFFVGGDYDVLLFQEENGSNYVNNIPGILANAGLGTYQGVRNGSSGLITRLDGTVGKVSLTSPGGQGRNLSYTVVNAEDGRPQTTVATVHLDYSDGSTTRLNEVKGITAWAKAHGGPLILAGDFNAGDVSERGLHRKEQQEFFLRLYTKNPNNSFYYTLLSQYAKDKTALDKFIADWRGKGGTAIDNAPIPPGLFEDETTPIAGNTPVTMNVLKKQFMLLQTDAEREQFAPHELNDGSGTWPSAGEDDTNTWGSWDRVKIDHFLASRPYGKWFEIVDDPNDPYLGVVKDAVANPPGGPQPLSDHEPVAHEFRWVGPKLETYTEDSTSKTRLVWDEGANTFSEDDKVFYLTRNNMRRDVYLGQVSDANGNPILTDLTDAEKKTLLDCKSADPRFQQAVVEYCIDDHSFIGETLVSDAGTVIVDEDLALGGADADVRLDDGTLRIAGTYMTKLDRSVVLETGGGTLDIADAYNTVTIDKAISGAGSLTKSGDGALKLTGVNTYTGETSVTGGLLAVDGSIASSALTTVFDGGVLGGTGTIGNLSIADGGTLAAGNSIGALKVAGDLTFAQGSIYSVEVDDTGKSDRVDVTGKTTIDGGTVMSIGATGNYKPYTDYVIISSTGGIEGTFDDVTSNFVFIDPRLIYGDTDLTLRLDRNDTAFDDVAETFNQRAAARGAESLDMGSPLYDALVFLDARTARSAFAQLAGEVHASTFSALINGSYVLRSAVLDRLRYAADVKPKQDFAALGYATFGIDETGKRVEGESVSPLNVWGKGYGSWAEMDGNGNAQGYSASTGGMFIGADAVVSGNWRLGMFGGYGRSSVDIDGMASSSTADIYDVGAYAGTTIGQVGLRFGASHSWYSIDSARSVAFDTFQERLTADYDASTTQLFGELSYQHSVGRAQFEPFANLAYLNFRNDAFTEEGGDAALTAEVERQETVFTTIGLRASTDFSFSERTGTLYGLFGWQHASGDVVPESVMSFSGGQPFTTRGAAVAEDVAVINAGVKVDLSTNAALGVSYSGQFGSGASQNGVDGTFSLRF
jgi:outer membrane autotransporter protein